jgi:hypothetical protein
MLKKLNLDFYKYRRVNILKANGKIRPLGVPTPAWRLHLSGRAMTLLHWLKPYMHPSQHAFYPGKGTDTAWQEIHARIIDKQYIFEYDLKNFYDSVNLDFLKEFLLKTGMPVEIVDQLIAWCRTSPKRVATGSNVASNAISSAAINRMNEVNKDKSPEVEVAFISQKATDLTWENSEEKSLQKKTHKLWVSGKDKKVRVHGWENDFNYFNGVAQGSAMSPVLSTVLLTHLLMLKYPDIEIVMYADDGIMASNQPFNPYELLGNLCKKSGIKAHLDAPKSKWVRIAGIWQCNLKFLGKLIVAKDQTSNSTGLLKNATRTPKEYTFSLGYAIGLCIEFDFWMGPNPEKPTRKILDDTSPYIRPSISDSWVDSKYFGYITSRIYNGSDKDLELLPEWKEYNFIPGSWSHLDALSKNLPIIPSKHKLGHLTLAEQPKLKHYLIGKENIKCSNTNLFNASSFATHFMLRYLNTMNLKTSMFKHDPWNDWNKRSSKCFGET